MKERKLTYQPNEKLMKAAQAYKGKWIVVLRDEILMAGDDPLQLQREVEERGIEYDVIDYVGDFDWEKPPLVIL